MRSMRGLALEKMESIPCCDFLENGSIIQKRAEKKRKEKLSTRTCPLMTEKHSNCLIPRQNTLNLAADIFLCFAVALYRALSPGKPGARLFLGPERCCMFQHAMFFTPTERKSRVDVGLALVSNHGRDERCVSFRWPLSESDSRARTENGWVPDL